jgi:hypothetical protein
MSSVQENQVIKDEKGRVKVKLKGKIVTRDCFG